jgi:hypothetical protein
MRDYNQEEGILDADQFREDSGNENNLSIFSIFYNNKYSNVKCQIGLNMTIRRCICIKKTHIKIALKIKGMSS